MGVGGRPSVQRHLPAAGRTALRSGSVLLLIVVACSSERGEVQGRAGPLAGEDAVLYAVGDVGDCNLAQDTATGLLLDGSSDPIALLGDVAYPNGSLANFAN